MIVILIFTAVATVITFAAALSALWRGREIEERGYQSEDETDRCGDESWEIH